MKIKTIYYKGGQKKIKEIGPVDENGRKNGIWQMFNIYDERLINIVEYKNNKKVGEETTFDNNGKVRCITNYVDGVEHGKKTKFYRTGGKSLECNFVNGQLHGDKIEYDTHGGTHSIVKYENGLAQGEAIQFFYSGNLHMKIYFHKGKKHGEAIYYHRDGETIAKRYHYKMGVLHGITEIFDKNGNIKQTRFYENGAIESEEFNYN